MMTAKLAANIEEGKSGAQARSVCLSVRLSGSHRLSLLLLPRLL